MKQRKFFFRLLEALMIFGLISGSLSAIINHEESTVPPQKLGRQTKDETPRRMSLREVKSRPQMLKELMQNAHNRKAHNFRQLPQISQLVSDALLSPFSAGRGQVTHVQHHTRTHIHHRRAVHQKVGIVKSPPKNTFSNIGGLLDLVSGGRNPLGALNNQATFVHQKHSFRHSSRRSHHVRRVIKREQSNAQPSSEQAFDNAIKKAFGIPNELLPSVVGGINQLPIGMTTVIPVGQGMLDILNSNPQIQPNRNNLPNVNEIFATASNPLSLAFAQENEPQPEQQVLGPFATVLKELLNDSQEMVKQRYNDGSNLDENDYHHKILEPVEIVYRNPKMAPKKTGWNPSNNINRLVERFKPIIFRINLPGASSKQFFESPLENTQQNSQENNILNELPFLNSFPLPLQFLFKTIFNLLTPITTLNGALSAINQQDNKPINTPALLQNLRDQLPQLNNLSSANSQPSQNSDSGNEYFDRLKNLLDKIKELLQLKRILAKLKQQMLNGNNLEQPPGTPELEQAVKLIEDLIKNIDILKNFHKTLVTDRPQGNSSTNQDPNNKITNGNQITSQPGSNNSALGEPNNAVEFIQKLLDDPSLDSVGPFNSPTNTLNQPSNSFNNGNTQNGPNAGEPSPQIKDFLKDALGPLEQILKQLNSDQTPQNNLSPGTFNLFGGLPDEQNPSNNDLFGPLNQLIDQIKNAISQFINQPTDQNQPQPNNQNGNNNNQNPFSRDNTGASSTNPNQNNPQNRDQLPITFNNPEILAMVNNLQNLGFNANPLIQYFNARDPSSNANNSDPNGNSKSPTNNQNAPGTTSSNQDGPQNVLFNADPKANDDLIKSLANLIDKLKALKDFQTQPNPNSSTLPNQSALNQPGNPSSYLNRNTPDNNLGNNLPSQQNPMNSGPQGQPNNNFRQQPDSPGNQLNNQRSDGQPIDNLGNRGTPGSPNLITLLDQINQFNILPNGQPNDFSNPSSTSDRTSQPGSNLNNNSPQLIPNFDSPEELLKRRQTIMDELKNQFEPNSGPQNSNPTINNYEFNHNVNIENPSAQLNGININHSTESSQGKHNHKIAIDINTYPKKKVTGILNKQLIDPCVEQNCDKDIEERAKEIMKIEKDEADGQKEETQEQKEQTARQENEKVLL